MSQKMLDALAIICSCQTVPVGDLPVGNYLLLALDVTDVEKVMT